MKNIFVYERNAFYYETDRMNVIHHSNYIRWFEEARINFMEKAGYPYDKMEFNGIMLPVLSADCSYKNSIHFGDTVLIHTAICQFNGFKMTLQYKIINKKNSELHAFGSTTHCFTDMNMKPIRIKKNYPEIYELFDKISPTILF